MKMDDGYGPLQRAARRIHATHEEAKHIPRISLQVTSAKHSVDEILHDAMNRLRAYGGEDVSTWTIDGVLSMGLTYEGRRIIKSFDYRATPERMEVGVERLYKALRHVLIGERWQDWRDIHGFRGDDG